MAEVKGKRSPMWALNAKMLIPCRDGVPYLFRRRLIQTPWFGVYLHDIFEPDTDQDPHDHPWNFVGLVLRGSYTEELHLIPYVDVSVKKRQTWKRWSWHRMTRETAHRIVEAEPGLRTLIFVGKRQRDWGFHTPYGWVPWQEYEHDEPKRSVSPDSS